jgi:hypothetical protein
MSAVDVRGKSLGGLVKLGGRGGGGGGRGGAQNPLGQNCVDFLTPEEYANQNGTLAVVTIANFQQLNVMANPTGGPGADAARRW